MAKIYDFDTKIAIETLTSRFEDFHDWIIFEFRVFIPDVEISEYEQVHVLYNAELVLKDPYGRFDVKRVKFCFSNIDMVSLEGLFELGSELAGLVVERTSAGIKLFTPDNHHLRISAATLTLELL
ncbi:hypothetical protein [Ruegeria atlantica]|uniref:hypothetical protein n=1 Tax=Ruegeria atlantica TaxID=81569 RepID=UPI001479DE2A|nr:hypothetical protein [Ruegeria atlantica]